MEKNIFNLNDKIYSNHNILLEIVSVLQQLMNYSKDNLIIKKLGKIINKMNYIIIENKKNLDLIRDDINKILNQMNDKNSVLKFNDIMNNKELKYNNGRYVGQVINGKQEGKGIRYWNDGNRYEGDFKNGMAEGKGIYYFNNGNRYEGDFKNGKFEGKGIYYSNNGDRYEGDWKNNKHEGKGIYYYNTEPWKGDRYEGDYKNGKREGKGIYYYNNGDREMGDWKDGKEIGKHVILSKNGEVKTENY